MTARVVPLAEVGQAEDADHAEQCAGSDDLQHAFDRDCDADMRDRIHAVTLLLARQQEAVDLRHDVVHFALLLGDLVLELLVPAFDERGVPGRVLSSEQTLLVNVGLPLKLIELVLERLAVNGNEIDSETVTFIPVRGCRARTEHGRSHAMRAIELQNGIDLVSNTKHIGVILPETVEQPRFDQPCRQQSAVEFGLGGRAGENGGTAAGAARTARFSGAAADTGRQRVQNEPFEIFARFTVRNHLIEGGNLRLHTDLLTDRPRVVLFDLLQLQFVITGRGHRRTIGHDDGRRLEKEWGCRPELEVLLLECIDLELQFVLGVESTCINWSALASRWSSSQSP